ncbi:MAG TPA: radical SAM protein, partial [Candidatus Deferrimicrobium sp.]|nr:radical SAM protein [Candidatus Deferrimicrobium sp.]
MVFERSKKSITRGIASAAFNMMGNLVKYHLLDQHRLSPLYVVWHPTLRCNLSCRFCDDGRGKKYPELRAKELPTEQAFQLLKLLRRASKAIYFTGGEPFTRKDFPELLSYSKQLGFQPIFVNTNLTQPDPLEESIENIDILIVSLGSTDCEKYDRIIKGIPGQTARIINTLEVLSQKQKSGGPLLVVNCVISADRFKDAQYVY